jgi:GNAT superfamily N-acetyltransferase
MSQIKVRLADWRDREVIQPLRRLLKRPVDGGLYELLNWPMYHAHVALVDGNTVGFSAVALHLGGIADDVGTVVHPDYRRKGVASELRATQVRDLSIMGFGHLYCAAPMQTPEAVEWCTHTIGRPVGPIDSAYMEPHLYFGNSLDAIKDNLRQMSVREPYPLSEVNVERLLHKIQRAIRDTAQLQSLGDFNMRKALLREGD